MKTLFSKLLIRFILISIIIIIILGSSLIYFFKGFYFSVKEEEIINNSQVILGYLSQEILKNDIQSVQNWLEVIARQNNGQAWLIDKDGYLILSYPFAARQGSKVKFKEYEDIFAGKIISQRVESSYFERPMLLIGLPILRIEDSKFGLLVFSSVAGINSTVSQVQKMMVYSSLIAVFLALLIAYTWSRSLSEPLKRMSKVAIELSDGEFGKTIPVEENNEIGKLASSINYMSKTLKTTIDNLVTERNKLKYVLTGMEEGVLAVDTKKKIILINDSARHLMGIERENADGHELSKIIRKTEVVELLNRTLKERDVFRQELHFKIDKIDKRILIHCTPIYRDEKQFWGVVALFQDISERWRFEQLQKDFVANVSHELKAPLSSIKGAGEILLDRVVVDSDKRDEYIEMIIEETDRLEELVNNILALSELDSSIPEHKMVKIDVNQLLSSVSNIFNKIIEKDDYNLKTILTEKQLFIRGNEERLKQVLLNLLDNAYKFSPETGVIEIGVKEQKDKIKFWVKDQGMGIPEAELENIWERFYKVDKARSPDTKGSGLGLAIVKQIIEETGGRVFVESKFEQGSIFGFYLPEV